MPTAGSTRRSRRPLSPDDLKRLYRAMLLGRRLDERMLRLQRQGRIGTFAPIKGQEASQLGSAFCLSPTDWMVPSFRETAAMIWRGWPIEKLLLYFSGYLEGGQPAPEQRDLPSRSRCRPSSRTPWGSPTPRSTAPIRRSSWCSSATGRRPRGTSTRLSNFAGVWRCPSSSSARTTSGPSRCRSRSRRTPARSPARRWPTAFPASRWTATTSWPWWPRAARRSSEPAAVTGRRSSSA